MNVGLGWSQPREEEGYFMNRREKVLLGASVYIAALFGVMPAANAMHIMEGFLPVQYCIAWGVISLPFVVVGFQSIKKTLAKNRRALTLLALAGAFVFVISSLKIPSVTGSSSHMTGTGLGAMLFGPTATSVLGLIVLIFQAVLLAHGGLTTLGANCFSMAIAGPLVSFGLYKGLSRTSLNRKVVIFIAAFLGDLFTYCVTAFQLALAHNEAVGFGTALVENLGVFAVTQIPLAVVEGILTVIIMIGLETYAKPELKAIGFAKDGE